MYNKDEYLNKFRIFKEELSSDEEEELNYGDGEDPEVEFDYRNEDDYRICGYCGSDYYGRNNICPICKNKNPYDVDDESSEDDDEIQEISSVTGMAGGDGYLTPKAFKNPNDKSKYKDKLGWKSVGNNSSMLNENIEKTLSPEAKMAHAIREIKEGLINIEKMVENAEKLKTEIGVGANNYWKRSIKAISNISERLIRLNHKINNIK